MGAMPSLRSWPEPRRRGVLDRCRLSAFHRAVRPGAQVASGATACARECEHATRRPFSRHSRPCVICIMDRASTPVVSLSRLGNGDCAKLLRVADGGCAGSARDRFSPRARTLRNDERICLGGSSGAEPAPIWNLVAELRARCITQCAQRANHLEPGASYLRHFVAFRSRQYSATNSISHYVV